MKKDRAQWVKGKKGKNGKRTTLWIEQGNIIMRNLISVGGEDVESIVKRRKEKEQGRNG